MTPLTREDLIRRHLAGSMSAVEQQEFQISLALDGELARMLNSHAVIDRAIAADRNRRALTDESAMRAHVLAMSNGLEPAPIPTGRRLPSTMIRRFAAASAIVLGTVGIYFMAEHAPSSPSPASSAPVITPRVEAPAVRQAPLAAPRKEVVAPARSETVKTAPSRRATAPVVEKNVVSRPEVVVETAPVESVPVQEVAPTRIDTVEANVVGRGVVSPMKNTALEKNP